MFGRLLSRFASLRSWSLAAVAGSMLLLAGCGGVQGTYVHEEKGPDGELARMTLVLKGDDVATMTLSGGPSGSETTVMSQTGTYKVDGDKVLVTMTGNTETLTLKDGALHANFMGDNVVLTKQ